MDILEQRLAPATFTVNDPSTADVDDPRNGNAETQNHTVTLVSALEQNEYDGGGDVITFDGPIAVTTGLGGRGSSTVSVTIMGINQGNGPAVTISNSDGSFLLAGDGSTVSDLNLINTVLAVGNNSTVEDVYSIGGSGLGQGIYLGDNSTLRDSVVSGHDFGSGGAILQAVAAGNGCTIANNFIGTTPDGTALLGNSGANGLVVGSNNSILNNVIAGNQLDGLLLQGSNNQVQGNRIGTDVSGTVAIPNGEAGIVIDGSQNVIGGGGGARNIISGNTYAVPPFGPGAGIAIYGGNSNIIQGNFVGIDQSGTQALGNAGDGIDINYANNTMIGGVGTGNIISGNTGDGIAVMGATGTMIEGNEIGTDSSGMNNVGNGGVGVLISGDNNQIGGTAPGEGNLIAFNGMGLPGLTGYGVQINAGTEDAIRDNSIFQNHGLGIRLFPGQSLINTINDPMILGARDPLSGDYHFLANDTRPGSNNGQNYPVLIGIDGSGNQTWMLNSTRDHNFEIDFFANTSPNPSGFGDGQTVLGGPVPVHTDGHGHAVFTVNFGAAPFLAATATDVTPGTTFNDTSQFSMVNTAADGIADAWKMWGIDIGQDGTPDLTLPDNNIYHKDLYVEVDALAGVPVRHDALALVQQAFAQAPNNLIHNPDGQDGINLYIQYGDTNLATNPGSAEPLWRTDRLANVWSFFDPLKAAHFGSFLTGTNDTPLARLAARLVYRYAIFGNALFAPGIGLISGISRGIPGNDFAITLGPRTSWSGGSVQEQAGTFMHELGHTLGLHHGGGGTNPDGQSWVGDANDNLLYGPGAPPGDAGDGLGYKPNYHSIMNYLWQLPWDGGQQVGAAVVPTAMDQAYHDSWFLDYSRQVYPTLDENNLSELAGIGGQPGTAFLLHDASFQWTFPTGVPDTRHFVQELGPVDWNNNGVIDPGTVQWDVNRDGRFDVLISHSDWSELSYYFLETPAYGGAHLGDDETIGATEDVTDAGLPGVHFLVAAPATVSPNMPFDVTVTALDANGNVVTNYQGTISFTTSDADPGVVLPADYTFTAADAGVHTFIEAVRLVSPGDQALTVLDTDRFTGTTTVMVTPPPLPPGGGGAQGLGDQGGVPGGIVTGSSPSTVWTAPFRESYPLQDGRNRAVAPRSEPPSSRRALHTAHEEAVTQLFTNWPNCFAPALVEPGAIGYHSS